MTGFIAFTDGRAWWGANWAYDAVVDEIADAVACDASGGALADWLREQRCQVVGLGMGNVDLRELTDENRRRIIEAIPRALDQVRRRGAAGWHDPSFFPAWLSAFELLVRMATSVERGEPPEALNPHMTGLLPATGERRGPGWE